MMLALFLALADVIPAETDLAQLLRNGRLLCSEPSETSKTCTTIDRLTVRPDGTMVETSETLLDPQRLITVEQTSVITVENGAVCSVVNVAEFQTSIVRANGTPLPPDRNAILLERLKPGMRPFEGHKFCEALQIKDGQLVEVARNNGLPLPVPASVVRWINSDEGWRVGPHGR